MSKSQGYTPTGDKIGQNPARSHFPCDRAPQASAKIDENMIISGSSLAKNVLFVCDVCEGALVPSSICIVCKKAFIRTCIKCGAQKKIGVHIDCCDLLLLGSIIKKHHEDTQV